MTDPRRIDANTVEATCTQCGIVKQIPMSEAKEQEWRGGSLIQNVLPEYVEREILISGLCDSCFDELFSDDTEMI